MHTALAAFFQPKNNNIDPRLSASDWIVPIRMAASQGRIPFRATDESEINRAIIKTASLLLVEM